VVSEACTMFPGSTCRKPIRPAKGAVCGNRQSELGVIHLLPRRCANLSIKLIHRSFLGIDLLLRNVPEGINDV